jgi:putative transposase
MDLCRLTRINSQLKLGPEKSGIFSQQLDQSIRPLGLWVLKMPPQRRQAKAICEWVLGILRRECLDFVMP